MAARRRTAPSSPDRWLDLAVRYLARWDRTVAQVERFLLAKGASLTQAKQTIEHLSSLRYLDDRAYAERWVEGRLARQPMGRVRLKAELQSKGVHDSVIDGVLHDSLRGLDEEELARRALQVRHGTGRRRVTPAQAVRLLRQRGFEEEVVARIMHYRDQHE